MGKVITGQCAAVAAAQHRMKTCTNADSILIVVTWNKLPILGSSGYYGYHDIEVGYAVNRNNLI